MMRRRFRRRRDIRPELDITAFMNLMVILVPFLLITAVFSRVTVMDLYLPGSVDAQAAKKPRLALEVIVRPAFIELADRNRGALKRVTNVGDSYNLGALSEALQDIKARFPGVSEASILVEPQIQYDTLVQVMDTVRMVEIQRGGQRLLVALFPEISLGDAPQTGRTGRDRS